VIRKKVVMAGLLPAIHVFAGVVAAIVDARHKPGHDELVEIMRKPASAADH
jgi:hypothetical protein